MSEAEFTDPASRGIAYNEHPEAAMTPSEPLLLTRDDESHAQLRDFALASPGYAEGVRAFLERRPRPF